MTVDAGSTPEAAPPRSAWRRWLARGVVLCLALAAGLVGWTWTHPDVPTFEYSYGISARRPVGTTLYTVLADTNRPGRSSITITGLEPIMNQDGARVDVEYLICDLDPVVLEKEGVEGFGFGGSSAAVARYCTSTRPAEDADLTLRADVRQALLVGITPTRPGRTVISGHHVTYRVGWQRGSSDIDVEIKLVGRRPR